MRFHAGALRTAAIVAAVFVATRVAYRIIFGGAAGGGVVLLDLPRVPLGGPFAHVVLFGPVTTGGLWNSALSALPFAAVILAFGVLNAVVDVQRLFVRGSTRGPLRAISRSLVIAWSTAPALAHAVRRVSRAAALRGERGAPALLVPVFEQTIERALGLAASMEVRGFASAHPAQSPSHADNHAVVTMADVALSHGHSDILARVTLRLDAGTLTVLTGPTGSGKSSLLRSLDGLFQHFDSGEQRGVISICGIDRVNTPPRDTAALVGSVAQNVRLGFATGIVREEIGFALAARGQTEAVIDERVYETADLLQITRLLDRRIDALSTGEATLVAIASALAARPVLLLVDEPLAELDTAARATVCAALDSLAHQHNVAVVVAEHQYAEWVPVADQWLTVRDGGVQLTAEPPATVQDWPAGDTESAHDSMGQARTDGSSGSTVAPQHPLAEMRALSVVHGATTVVQSASLTVAPGEVLALAGPNGVGKSSLLLAMARADAVGTMLVRSTDIAGLTPQARRRHVTLVPERVDELFFHTTVAAECQRADKIDKPRVSTAERLATLLGVSSTSDLAALLSTHPRDLSAGQQLCLAIAIQLAPSPSLLLVDEPSRGLDPRSRETVGRALQHAAADASRAVLFATHDSDFSLRFAQRSLTLSEAGLAERPVSEVPR